MDNKDFSLIDANIARAAEGLRVMEDIARFVICDESSFDLLKILRHRLLYIEEEIGPASLMSARGDNDIGNKKVVNDEYSRSSIWGLIRSNACRVSQSFRVLEEFTKIYLPGVSQDIEAARYTLYTIEHCLLIKTPQFWLQNHFEHGVVYPISDDIEALARYIRKGARIVQFRDKTSTKRRVFQKTKSLCLWVGRWNHECVEKYRTLVVLNDYIDIAAELPVDGVHIGQIDEGLENVRKKIGVNKIIGCSTHTAEQAEQAEKNGADYISIGPVFATPIKPELQAIGIEQYTKIVQNISLPKVAIGGVDTKNVQEIYSAGMRNVAVVRAAKDFFV